MASLVLTGDTSGQVTLAAPAVAGTNTATLPVATGELSMLGGTGQNWTDVTASRASGTTYTNTTGKPILVNANSNTSSGGSMTCVVSGVTINNNSTGTTSSGVASFIVPPSATYRITFGTYSLSKWSELR